MEYLKWKDHFNQVKLKENVDMVLDQECLVLQEEKSCQTEDLKEEINYLPDAIQSNSKHKKEKGFPSAKKS